MWPLFFKIISFQIWHLGGDWIWLPYVQVRLRFNYTKQKTQIKVAQWREAYCIFLPYEHTNPRLVQNSTGIRKLVIFYLMFCLHQQKASIFNVASLPKITAETPAIISPLQSGRKRKEKQQVGMFTSCQPCFKLFPQNLNHWLSITFHWSPQTGKLGAHCHLERGKWVFDRQATKALWPTLPARNRLPLSIE